MTYRTTLTRTTDMQTTEEDFGTQDAKGRRIGARIRTWETLAETAAPDACMYYHLAPGTYFTLDVQATRDGTRFGASQHLRYFATAAERDNALARYLIDARKRAAR
jgi:hypothetical protein